MTKEKKPEISPCPFCGGTYITWHAQTGPEIVTDGKKYKPFCRKCGGSIRGVDTKAEAIAAWNRRHFCDDHRCCCNTCDHKCGIELIQENDHD